MLRSVRRLTARAVTTADGTAGDEHDVGRLDGDVGAGAQRDAHIGGGQHGASLIPSPTKATLSPSARQFSSRVGLVPGRQAAMGLRYAERAAIAATGPAPSPDSMATRTPWRAVRRRFWRVGLGGIGQVDAPDMRPGRRHGRAFPGPGGRGLRRPTGRRCSAEPIDPRAVHIARHATARRRSEPCDTRSMGSPRAAGLRYDGVGPAGVLTQPPPRRPRAAGRRAKRPR
jgi:hypothetical protein